MVNLLNNQNFINSATLYDIYGSLKINTMSYLVRNGCKIYCNTNNDNFIYETDGKTYNIPNNNNYAQFNSIERSSTLSSATRFIDVYVDNTYTGNICDGTENRPYKTIQEAISNGIVNGCKTIIFVKDGTYEEDYLTISNISSHVVIQCESKAGTLIKNIYISNCKALCIKDCTIYDTKDNTITIGAFSNVEFNNVLINGQTATSLHRGIGIYDSELKIKNCTISNKSIAISVNDMSKLYIDGLDGSNNEYVFNSPSYAGYINEQNLSISYTEYMFYTLYGKFSGQKTNRSKSQLETIIRTGNAFNTIFFDNTDFKPVMYIGSKWIFMDGTDVT